MDEKLELELENLLEDRTKPTSRTEWIEIAQSSEESLYDYRIEHTRRVVKLCKTLASHESVDLDVLVLSAWLHDIAKP